MSNRVAIILWLYYEDQWAEIYSLIKPIDNNISLYIGLCKDHNYSEDTLNEIKGFSDYTITYHDNFGADVAPFIQQISVVKNEYFIKIHTKKSFWGKKSNVKWKDILFHDLIGSKEIFIDNLNRFNANKNIGMISNRILLMQNREYTNSEKIKELCSILDIDYNYVKNNRFAAGNIFMSRTKLFQKYFNNKTNKILLKKLSPEIGKVCDKKGGKYAHSLERIFGYIVYLNNMIYETPKHTYVSIINTKSENGYFKLVSTYSNYCYLQEDLNAYGKILKNELKELLIEWYHLEKPIKQLYAKIDDETIVKYEELDSNKSNIINVSNFDHRVYRIMHPDLFHMSNDKIYEHFYKHGIKENRKYILDYSYSDIMKHTYDKNSKINSEIFYDYILINHDNSRTGAPAVLVKLYKYLTQLNYNVLFIETAIHDNYQINNICYHLNNPYILKKILSKLKFGKIISNSLNIYLKFLHLFTEYHDKTVFYLHESYKGYSQFIEDDTKSISHNSKIVVVADAIRQDFVDNHFQNVSVLPPFFLNDEKNRIIDQSKEQIDDVIKNINFNQNIDFTKIIYCMCGSIDDRKNFKLFCEVARILNDNQFLWIGGNKHNALSLVQNIPDNVFLIENTSNPYKYVNICDYFFLTSKNDPCPLVILESILLNKKNIVLKNNIAYEHKTKELENFYVLSDHHNDAKNISKQILNLKPNKDKNTKSKNYQYIDKYFSERAEIQNLLDQGLDS